MGFFADFKASLMKGDVLSLATAVVIGGAFGKIVGSAVDDVIMPPIGMILGNVDFSNLYVVLKEGAIAAAPYASLADAKKAGAVTINYGVFVNSVISFLIVAFAVFMLIRNINRLKQDEAPAPVTTKDCPFCASSIPLKATRCPHCTSELK